MSDDSLDGGQAQAMMVTTEEPVRPGEGTAADDRRSVSSSASESATTGGHSSVSNKSTSGETEQENAEKYCEGGYHPIKIADVISDRYHIVRKIGFGHFSTVWLAWDNKSSVHDPEFRALKISKSEKVFADATKTEIMLLTKIAEADANHPYRKFLAGLLDSFDTISPNGRHICMVTHCHGDNLLQLIQRGHHKGLPEANVKSITKQVLQGLSYLHDICGIIHTDIKPENVLIEVSPVRVKKLAMGAVDMHRKGVKFPAEFVASHELVSPVDEEDADDENGNDRKIRKKENATAGKDQATAGKEQVTGAKDQVPAGAESSSQASPWRFPEATIKSILAMDHKDGDPALEACEITIKIADFGNSCFVDNHYAYMIQTLPYRSLEVVIQAGYGAAADIWSLACMAFELATGDYLFDGMVGKRFAKTEDHLGHIVELLGNVPMPILKKGKVYQRYFKYGKLKKYQPRKFWPLKDVLIDKYEWPEERAEAFSSLLLPMLHYDQDQRIAAEPASQHPYLT